uniref:Fungal lipase-type domain-containing protein n=1 Tax=Entomoneis paludosa TaxID=265537 RepID=A0A6U3B3B4_9STRA|mmetsp:Transcript_28677/g.59932  ORF Transcript_28677/g.59932 Transcript_28677/m.59932 type:complete len:387 (+) Transcript_28677:157-1317(+)|eukprot:CAMPEP_0172455260 /NCGR_PEP_ID=MMETSP1065-20121228/11977_1 /TAXON_ID=265537 /ORGANISM="Amphiprora paludosa, Strain CCMP125" /LENGTH=386 /DNA_ID=CAMNT_0013207721 /DNA_START=115 /DNA_END=1275 /DNA_ORIENTATION=+
MSRHPFTWPSDLGLELQGVPSSQLLAVTLKELHGLATHGDGSVVVEGLALEEDTGRLLLRQMTAEQVLLMVQDNADIVPHWKQLHGQLSSLVAQQQAPGSTSLVAWEEDSWDYVVVKNDKHKRFTVVFLDQSTSAASGGCLATPSLQTWEVPPTILNSVPVESVQLEASIDLAALEDLATTVLRPLLRPYPKYKLYVTGHGVVAGAKAQIAAVQWCTHVSLPKPVTCLTTGAPRVGNADFLTLCSTLEQLRYVRLGRLVLEGDSQPMAWAPGLCHVGFQIGLAAVSSTTATEAKAVDDQKSESSTLLTTEQDAAVQLTYPKLEDTMWNRLLRAWQNRMVVGSAATPTDYATALASQANALELLDLNEAYLDEEMTGFVMAPMPVEK